MATHEGERSGSRREGPPPASPDRWVVYVLRCSDATLYTGITNDLEGRLQAHRAGRGARYTRGRLPLELVHAEQAGSRGAAARREREIKSLDRGRKLALVARSGT